MKINFSLLSIALTLIVCSCHTPLSVSDTKVHHNTKIDNSILANKSFAKIIAPYKMKMDAKMNEKIAHTNFNLSKSGQNSSLGNLLADYTLEGAENWASTQGYHIDGAIINIGGIRSTIGEGDILLKHIFEVMPFENEVMIVKFKGSDIQEVFDYYKVKQKNNPVANFVISVEKNIITKALINGKPIDVNKNYYIATSDYLVGGGDGMDFFKKGEAIPTGIKLRDLFIQLFKEKQEIIPPTDIRLTFKDNN